MNAKDLHPYQRTSVAHIMGNPFCGLFLDMGLGKTVTVLTSVAQLIFDELEVERVIIIAPKRVAENVWTSEQRKWEHLKGLSISVVAGNERQRIAALKDKAHIYTVSRDNVDWLVRTFPGFFRGAMVVIDESSSFKAPSSMRFKALKRVQPTFGRCVLLTGTPAPNTLADLWSQIWLLDRGERLGKTITVFRECFMQRGHRGVWDIKMRDDAEAKIHAAIADIVISMKAEDYLDLPECITNDVEVVFPEKLMKQYRQFERDAVMQILETDGEVTAANAAELSTKLRQFAQGAVYDEHREVHLIHELKLDALEEIVEAAQGRPVLVGYAFQHDRDRILERLAAYRPVQMPKGDSGQVIDDWNAGRIRVLMMHPASGGHGLNLQAGGNRVVWFGLDWSLELYQQFIARLHRQGKTEVTFVDRIVAKGTIDADIIAALDRKDAGQEKLMQAVKARVQEYFEATVLK